MTPQEQLERIINDWGKSIVVDKGLIEDLANAILSAGYSKQQSQVTYDIEGNPDQNGIYRITNVKIAGQKYIKKDECYPKDFCDVCWTSSWTPCPEGTPNAQKVMGKEAWVICTMCELEKQLHTNYVKKDEIRIDGKKTSWLSKER